MSTVPGTGRTSPDALGLVPWRGHAEFQLLLALARADLGPTERARVGALLEMPVDWQQFFRLAHRHRLLPLCTRHLNRSESHRVPAAVLQAMRDYSMRNARRNLLLTGQLWRLIQLMADAGIPMVGYKGPVLAQRVYGSIALRDILDLDLLVRPQDVQRALNLLLRKGYSPAAPADARWDSYLFRSGCNYPLVHDVTGTVVELHWKPEISITARQVGELWSRVEQVSLAGVEVPTFARNDLLVLLSMHGCRHMWERLEWVVGVAELLRMEDVSAESALSLATCLGGRRALFIGLVLAHELLAAPVTPEVLRLARADREAVSLATTACRKLFSDGPLVAHQLGFPFHSFQLRSRERLRDRTRYLRHRTMAPSRQDWEAGSQPWILFRVRSVVRRLRSIAAYTAWSWSGAGPTAVAADAQRRGE